MEIFGILNTDPVMWLLELLAVIEMTVLPLMMVGAFGVVSYDAYKNPEMLLFLKR